MKEQKNECWCARYKSEGTCKHLENAEDYEVQKQIEDMADELERNES